MFRAGALGPSYPAGPVGEMLGETSIQTTRPWFLTAWLHTPTLTGPQGGPSKLCRGSRSGFPSSGWPGRALSFRARLRSLPGVRRPLPNLQGAQGASGSPRSQVHEGGSRAWKRERGPCWGEAARARPGWRGQAAWDQVGVIPFRPLSFRRPRSPSQGAGPFKRARGHTRAGQPDKGAGPEAGSR